MKAVVLEGKGQVAYRDVEKPICGDDDIILEVKACGICGSDLHIARGLHPSAPLPVTIGHEFSGDVVAIGSEVTKARLGERVTGQGVALDIAELFLNTAFEGGRHLRRINQIEG